MRKDAAVWNLFAQTECIGPIFLPAPNGPIGNVGTDLELVKTQVIYLIIDYIPIVSAKAATVAWTRAPHGICPFASADSAGRDCRCERPVCRLTCVPQILSTVTWLNLRFQATKRRS